MPHVVPITHSLSPFLSLTHKHHRVTSNHTRTVTSSQTVLHTGNHWKHTPQEQLVTTTRSFTTYYQPDTITQLQSYLLRGTEPSLRPRPLLGSLTPGLPSFQNSGTLHSAATVVGADLRVPPARDLEAEFTRESQRCRGVLWEM